MNRILIPFLFVFLISISSLIARPPGKGPDREEKDFRGVFHSLFAEHKGFEREVEVLDNGYRAVTTSDDPKLALLLQEHVAQMEERLEGGLGIRRWDPAFAELMEHHQDMGIEVKNIKTGVSVVVTGKTPEAVQVAMNHAKIISGFIDKGESQMHATHAAVVASREVPKGEKGEAVVSSACGCSKDKAACKGKEKGTDCGKNCDCSCGKGARKATATDPQAE